MNAFLTVAIWTLSLLSLVAAGAMAAELVLIPTSIDIGEVVTGGMEPWRDAALAAGFFLALLVATAVSLRLWHSARFKPLAAVMTLAEAVVTAWFGLAVFRDYF